MSVAMRISEDVVGVCLRTVGQGCDANPTPAFCCYRACLARRRHARAA